jgi:hypothetical protein
MTAAFNLFLSMLDNTNTIMTLYEYLRKEVNAPVDYSDLLRWQWVQGVSALDKYIHDIVRIGMLEIYAGRRRSTKKYFAFTIDLKTHIQMSENQTAALSIFEQQILLRNSYLAFQEPEKISDALAYIWNEEHKWRAIADKMGKKEPDVKTTLKNISIRRNQIAHEGDYSNILLQRQEITKTDVIDVIGFIKQIGSSIHTLIESTRRLHA